MVYTTALKRGLRLAGRIDQKYNINKIFIQKYVPPGYRKRANKIVDVAGTLSGGYGIYGFINSLIAPESPGNSGFPEIQQRQRFTSRKSYKTRYRSAVCGPYRRRKYRNRTY